MTATEYALAAAVAFMLAYAVLGGLVPELHELAFRCLTFRGCNGVFATP